MASANGGVAVPFVASPEATSAAGNSDVMLAAQLIAVSLSCDHCATNSADVFCVHRSLRLQKLCLGCDALLLGGKRLRHHATSTGTASFNSGGGISSNAASKHLRLERNLPSNRRRLASDEIPFLPHLTAERERVCLTPVLNAQLACNEINRGGVQTSPR